MAANLQELKQKAKLPANQAGGNAVKDFFEANKSNIAAVLPKHVTPDRMVRIALGALRQNPKLMQCTTESLVGGVMQCAQLGLEPNTPLGHAYLIPFDKRAKKNGQWVVERTDVQVVMGYKGLIDLARRSGQIVSIAAHAVYENDVFEFEYGLDEKLKHVPTDVNRGEIVHFYAVAKLVGGGHAFEVMSATAVNRIRDESNGYKTAVRMKKEGEHIWTQHYEQMGRKTVLRRLFKYLPVSIELATAVSMDEVADNRGDQHLGDVLHGDYSIVPQDYEAVGDEQEEAADESTPDQEAAGDDPFGDTEQAQ